MDRVEPSLTPLAVTVSRPERVFPTLAPEQVSRIAAHGRRRSTGHGEVLVEVGDKAVPIFVVVGGELQACTDGRQPDVDRDPSVGAILRRSQHDHRSPHTRTPTCQRAWRSDSARS